jgi:hypothetical protein
VAPAPWPGVAAVSTWLVTAPPPLRFGVVAIASTLFIERARPSIILAVTAFAETTTRVLFALVILLPAYFVTLRIRGSRLNGLSVVQSVDEALDGAVDSVTAMGALLRRTIGWSFRVPWKPVIVVVLLLVPLWYLEPSLPTGGPWAPVGEVGSSVQAAWTPFDCWVVSVASRWASPSVPSTCGPRRNAVVVGRACR